MGKEPQTVDPVTGDDGGMEEGSDFGARAGCIVLMALILYIDLNLPLGVAVGSLYILAVLLSLWSRHRRFIIAVAAASSILVVFAWLVKPPVEGMWKVAYNRSLALFTIWATALLSFRIKAIHDKLVRVASHDFLTGLLNRREAFNRLQVEMSRVHRSARPFSIIMLDIDHFKAINDGYGHDAGDEVLKGLALVLGGGIRKYDYACRYGGEEFLVVAPETPLEVAHELAERLRRAVAGIPFTVTGHDPFVATVSAGVAQLESGETLSGLIARADAALYRAKEGGRNRVVLSRPG